MTNKIEINRLIYQSWHRGCKELDILLGYYAKAELPTINDKDLEVYKSLCDEDDYEIYEWLTKDDALIPDRYQDIILKIKQFNQNRFKK